MSRGLTRTRCRRSAAGRHRPENCAALRSLPQLIALSTRTSCHHALRPGPRALRSAARPRLSPHQAYETHPRGGEDRGGELAVHAQGPPLLPAPRPREVAAADPGGPPPPHCAPSSRRVPCVASCSSLISDRVRLHACAVVAPIQVCASSGPPVAPPPISPFSSPALARTSISPPTSCARLEPPRRPRVCWGHSSQSCSLC